jgi:hypothetical protein
VAWGDSKKYACDCPVSYLPVTNSLECCGLASDPSSIQKCLCADGETLSTKCCNNQFLPKVLDVLFDEIPAEDVVKKIVDEIDPFLHRIFTEPGNDAFTLHNNKDKVKRWNWEDAGFAESATKVSGMYESTQPIMNYNESEVGYPFKGGKSMWQVCLILGFFCFWFCFCFYLLGLSCLVILLAMCHNYMKNDSLKNMADVRWSSEAGNLHHANGSSCGEQDIWGLDVDCSHHPFHEGSRSSVQSTWG